MFTGGRFGNFFEFFVAHSRDVGYKSQALLMRRDDCGRNNGSANRLPSGAAIISTLATSDKKINTGWLTAGHEVVNIYFALLKKPIFEN